MIATLSHQVLFSTIQFFFFALGWTMFGCPSRKHLSTLLRFPLPIILGVLHNLCQWFTAVFSILLYILYNSQNSLLLTPQVMANTLWCHISPSGISFKYREKPACTLINFNLNENHHSLNCQLFVCISAFAPECNCFYLIVTFASILNCTFSIFDIISYDCIFWNILC